MTPRGPDPLGNPLRREHAAVRRALIARHSLRALAACGVLVALLVAAGVAWPGGPAFATFRLVLLGSGVAIGAALAAFSLRRDLPAFTPWLERIETRFPELRSWVRNALELEVAPPHTSPELAAALRAEAAERLGTSPLAGERPRAGARAPLLVASGALAAVVLLGLLAPQAALRSWRTLWRPSLAAPPVMLAVEPGSVTLAPGSTLAVHARVSGTGAAPRLLGEGAAPAPQLESTDAGIRRWRFDLPPVTRARRYAVRVQATRSPDYLIALAGEPQPVSFTLEVRAPAYARLPVQVGTSTRGDLTALVGSTVRVEATFDRDLDGVRARLPDGRRTEWSPITPRRWRGEVPVREDGSWSLRAEAASGTSDTRYRIAALPDAPPVLTVVEPRGDQDLPPGSQLPFDVLAQDDLGLLDLALQFRKDASQPWKDVPLSRFAGEPREARVTSTWDAGALALLPGETGALRFVLRDDNSFTGPGVATSPEFHLRFPTLAQLYDRVDERQDGAQRSLEKVAEQARELQRSLDELQRMQPRAGVTTPPPFERTEEMRKALERQQDLGHQIDKAVEDTRESLTDAAERQAFRQDLQQKLQQMSELMRQIQSQELRDAVKRMQQALQNMDRSQMEQTLPQLREQNHDLLQNLDRSLALLKQLRDEERMDALAHRAEELKSQQDALNQEHDAHAQADSTGRNTPSESERKDLAARQRDAAQQSEQLAHDAHAASEQSDSPETKSDLENAEQELEQRAASDQQNAASQGENGQSQQARSSGRQASQSLERAAQRMNSGSQASQQQRAARQLAAVRRSTQDLVSLGEEASQNLQSGDPAGEQSDRQTDLSAGVEQIADSLAELGKETPVLSPKVQEALGRAMKNLSSSGQEMARGNMPGGQHDGSAARAALSEAINGLRDAEQSMCNKPGNKPGDRPGSNSAERVGQMSREQSRLNERAHELAQRLSQATRLTTGDREQMRRLAEDQARIRAELEEVQRDEAAQQKLLGRLDQTRQDMQQVEEQLRDGPPPGDDLEQEQTHILSRLLDAQRSINRRDYDPQREAVHAQDVAHASPPPLPAGLLRESDRMRLDLMKADADRYPAQYRALVERYLERLNGSVR